MRRTSAAIIMIALAAFSVRAWQADTDGVPRIAVKELKEKLDKKEKVVVVDVRRNIATKIKGALHIPLDELEQRLNELPKDNLIVTVCS